MSMRATMMGSAIFASVATLSMIAVPALAQEPPVTVRDHRRHPPPPPPPTAHPMRPIVRGMAPKMGAVGSTVTLRGRFAGDAKIYFGKMEVTPSARTPRQIQFVVPQVPPGKRVIRVVSAGGTVNVGQFMVPPPTGEPPGHVPGTPMPPDQDHHGPGWHGDHDGDHDHYGDHDHDGDHDHHGGAPIVTDYWPRKGPPGTQVAVTGRRFGPGWTLMLGNQTVVPRHVTPESLIFNVPQGAHDGVIVLRHGRYDIPVGRFTISRTRPPRDERARERARWHAEAEKYWRRRQAKLAHDIKARRAELAREEAELARARAERRRKRLAEIRARWQAAFLTRPEVRAELSLHANRSARLARMERLAETGNYGKLAVRIQVLKRREDARHDQRMQDLKAAYARN